MQNLSSKRIYVHGELLKVKDVRYATDELLHSRRAPMQRIVSYLYEHDTDGLDVIMELMSKALQMPKEIIWEDLRTLVLQ